MTLSKHLVLAGFILSSTVATFAWTNAGMQSKPKPKKAATVKKAPAKKMNTVPTLKSGIDLTAIDKGTSPAVDFNQYVNGNWYKTTNIPASESRWGAFSILSDKNKTLLRKICEDDAKNAKASKNGSNTQLVGDFWASGMDSGLIQTNGYRPILPDLRAIDAIQVDQDIMPVVAMLHRKGVNSLFGLYAEQDAKNSTRYILYYGQGGLGLPDRDYYFKEDERSVKLREAYKQHVYNMFKLIELTDKEATEKTKLVLEFETKIAEASMNRLEMRDPYATYNLTTYKELQDNNKFVNFQKYWDINKLPEVNELVVSQPKQLQKVNELFQSASMESWRAYLQWTLIHGYARYLSDPFVNENFSFYGKTLTGAKEAQPRWKRTLAVVDGSLGEALGQEYVKVAFTPDAKERMLKLVSNLKVALGERIDLLEWMSAATKKEAHHKLNTITVKIGYPDVWKTYDGLIIAKTTFVRNIMNSSELEYKRNMDKIGKPIDRTEWGMTPPTINAYYNPSMNEIVFPAGILQPPFFDPNADDAVNYGGIGAVIGHELTHGFDDEGRKFDADGNLKDWWTEEDAKQFEARTGKVVDQFNGYIGVDTTHVNGQLTLGENIADLGGLKIAYEAYKKSLNGKPAPVIDGFTGDQRFFIGWAQVWRIKARPEAVQQQMLTDPHSPAQWRINGPLSNLPEFWKAFNVKTGQPMRMPADKQAQIW